MLITDFSNLARQKWVIVNDTVMGGKSVSHFQINQDGNGVFSGNISHDNNGGFASVKNHEPLNLAGYTKIMLKIMGDGNRFSFRLQTGEYEKLDRWSYEHRFSTQKNEWKDIELDLSQFHPTYRGKTQESVPDLHLNLENIKRFGFLISEKQQGDFRLEIDRIEAFP